LAFSDNMAAFTSVRLLAFRVADRAFAAEAAAVREILPAQRATRIPGAAKEVRGLINARGILITVVDGRVTLGFPPGGDDGPIVVFDVNDKSVGFAVDAVLDLVTVPGEELTERADLPGLDPRLVRAVGRHAEQSFVLLDVDTLLRPIMAA
jgi:purine-binding chemotaxis protein CheW